MSGSNSSAVTKLVQRVFPKMPDFFGLLNDQCDNAVEALTVFEQFMKTGDEALALRVRALEHQGDELKDRNLDVLNSAFSTPMDREELYRAIATIDHVINYAKTTVREMEVLGVTPDAAAAEMATHLREGTEALRDGYAQLATNPGAAEPYAQAARKSERNAEKSYRNALADLFNMEETVTKLETFEGRSGPQALLLVMDVFKRREIYRHLANAADRLAHAGDTLHDIVVKMV
jgi:uncharacterized protein Yka (UPF0111/DUF47 family)